MGIIRTIGNWNAKRCDIALKAIAAGIVAVAMGAANVIGLALNARKRIARNGGKRMDENELKTIISQVREILRTDKNARDDDRILYESLLFAFYPRSVKIDDGKVWTLATDHTIPSYARVIRCRAIVQNKQRMYLPTLAVAIARGIDETEWRAAMSNLPLFV